MIQQDLIMQLGSVEPQRPLTTPLRASRTWMLFDTKESALRWASRNRPDLPAGTAGCSAHPRVRLTATAEFALIYDVTLGVPRKMPSKSSNRHSRAF